MMGSISSAATSSQVGTKLKSLANLARLFERGGSGDFIPSWDEVKKNFNFRTSCPEVNCGQVGHNFRWSICGQLLAMMARSKWCPSWTPFPSEHGLSKRFPSWEPFLRSTSGQLDQKLIVTMMVHISRAGTSDQVGPKLGIRAKLARIIWPGRRQKREPSWLTFHRGPLLKMRAKLALLFYERMSLEMWD